MASTRKLVLSQTLQHPLTLFPTAIGCLGSLSAVLFGASPLTAGVAVGGLAIGIGSWVVNYFVRGQTFANAQVRALHAQLEQQRQEILKDLEQRLRDSHGIAQADHEVRQALRQFSMVQERFEVFQRLLQDKLSTTEFTYSRYYVAAEQVVLSVLDNLRSLVGRLQSIAAIDPRYIAERKQAIADAQSSESTDAEELAALDTRLALRNEQLAKVNGLLTYNEKALTELDRTNSAIADMKSSKSQASAELESAMQELEILAARAKRFSAT